MKPATKSRRKNPSHSRATLESMLGLGAIGWTPAPEDEELQNNIVYY
jgi:hypothetical protein